MTAVFALALLLAEDPEALSARALDLARQQRTDEASRLWKQALQQQPGLFSAAFNLGYLHYSRKEFAEAAEYLEQAAKSQPKDFNSHYLLGASLSQLGNTDPALRAWRQALAMRPDHLKLMQVMAVEYAKGRYYREAAAVAERALALQPGDAATYQLAIKAWQDAGDRGAALKLAATFVQRFPALPRADFEYGYELHRAGRSAEAIPYLRKATEATEPWEEPFFFYGDALVSQSRMEEALAPLQRAVELRPDYVVARTTLARALMSLGRTDEAKQQLLAAVAANPRHPQPHLILSQLYFRLGDEEAAARERALSLKLRRENPESMEGAQSRPFPQ